VTRRLFGEWTLPAHRDTEKKFNVLVKKLLEPIEL
jgi:hypothetical protein